MLIRDRSGLDLLRLAQEEIRETRRAAPSAEFYAGKLAQVWDRARKSEAFSEIGDFSPEDFASLPLTGKDDLKAHPWRYAVADLPAAAKYYETTGTSGRVTPTPRLLEDIVWNTVSVAEAWRGVLGPSERVAILLPSDIVPVADLIVSVCEYLGLPHSRVYPFATGISDWDRLTQLWRSLRPTTVFAAPGVMLQLTRLLARRGELEELSATADNLMLLGEVSTPALRTRLGAWWDADAYDVSYGSTETGTLAATCPRGRLHLLRGSHYFELVTDRGVVPDPREGVGRLVTTPLNLHARPLLRMDTGDEVEITGAGCGCGDPAPVLVVRGRSSEALRVADARLTVHTVEQVVYGTTSAAGYLLEIDEGGDSARLLLERFAGRDPDRERADVTAVQDASREAFGLTWSEVAFVNSLPARTKSGASQKSWKRSNVRVVERAA